MTENAEQDFVDAGSRYNWNASPREFGNRVRERERNTERDTDRRGQRTWLFPRRQRHTPGQRWGTSWSLVNTLHCMLDTSWLRLPRSYIGYNKPDTLIASYRFDYHISRIISAHWRSPSFSLLLHTLHPPGRLRPLVPTPIQPSYMVCPDRVH